MKKYLICGLGNPGTTYANTRHNIGFEAIQAILTKLDAKGALKPARYAERAVLRHQGHTLCLLRPTTFMNESGKALRYWAHKENINLDHILVIVDDIALDLGQLRLRISGSSGGHNGLKSIQQQLNTQHYARLRIGIGNHFARGKQTKHVLGTFTEEENNVVKDSLALTAEVALRFCTDNTHKHQNTSYTVVDKTNQASANIQGISTMPTRTPKNAKKPTYA